MPNTNTSSPAAARRPALHAAALAAALMLAAAPAPAQAPGTGQVELQATAIAAGIGFVIGEGTLTLAGQKQRFSLSGFSVIDVGVAGLTAQGTVENLRELSQFAGNYASIDAGVTLAGGGSAMVMRNQHGVVMRLTATSQGARLQLAPEGLLVRLR